MLQRLQKILSARGIASRRKAEEYISAGLVRVNGEVAKLGDKADPDIDTIDLDGKVLEARQEMLYYLMHKPIGIITTNIDRNQGNQGREPEKKFRSSSVSLVSSDSSESSSVRDLIPENLRGKIFPVGRLDKDSSGLLILTNDGVLAYRLTHPKFDHEKEYEVQVANPITEGALDKLRQGMMILGEKTKPAKVAKTGAQSFRIVLTEGKNRQIRRMCQKVGNPVDKLTRVRIMNLQDNGLKPGQMRELTEKERSALLKEIGL